jgi:hypothetical protein
MLPLRSSFIKFPRPDLLGATSFFVRQTFPAPRSMTLQSHKKPGFPGSSFIYRVSTLPCDPTTISCGLMTRPHNLTYLPIGGQRIFYHFSGKKFLTLT